MENDNGYNLETNDDINKLIKKRRRFFILSLILSAFSIILIVFLFICCLNAKVAGGLAFLMMTPLMLGFALVSLICAIFSIVFRHNLKKKIGDFQVQHSVKILSIISAIAGFAPLLLIVGIYCALLIPPQIRHNQACAEYHEFDNIQKSNIVLIGTYAFDSSSKSKYLTDHQGELGNKIVRDMSTLKKDLGNVIDDSDLLNEVDFVHNNYLIKLDSFSYPAREDLLLQAIIPKINFHEKDNETIVFIDYNSSVWNGNEGKVPSVRGWTVYLVPISKEYSDESTQVRVENGIGYAGCKKQ